MYSDIDERKGLVKTNWQYVRKRVAKVEPAFAKMVDELNPDESFVVYLAYYPYGAIKGDTESTLLPTHQNTYYRISNPDTPQDVLKQLGYSKNSAPFAMLLEKNLELFVELPDEKISIPWILYSPGSIFPFARILSRKHRRTYDPNGVLTLSSGARSTFMLPNIGCATYHANLQRDFNVQVPTPKSMHEHWNVFREITNSQVLNCDWRSCLLYFGSKWLEKLDSDSAWLPLKLYLHELAWYHCEYQRNRFYYDLSFSIIQKNRNLKPNPYLADTARHLFAIALGAAPGYAPAINDDALPTQAIQQVFTDSYRLDKYDPIILQPTHFNYEQDDMPIYYSLQHPSTHMFSPKSRKISSTLSEMRELHHITNIFSKELAKENSLCSDTILSKITSNINFDFFHNKPDRHQIIQASHLMAQCDTRFKYQGQESKFASDSPFVRGCIRIKKLMTPKG